jgi:large subunit ribosomal protein L28
LRSLQPVFRKRIKDLEMSRICQITGKAAMVGNNVSHSKRRTKRTFDVNLFDKKVFLQEENRWVSLRVSAAGLRFINKVGVKKALEEARTKGYLKTF